MRFATSILVTASSILVTACGLCFGASLAEAQTPKNNLRCSDRAQAKKAFNGGRLAYRRGDYEEAIVKWQESYAMCEEPLIHLNIANAYERIGNVKLAFSHLRRWRAVAPAREHAELDRRLVALQLKVQEVERKEAAAAAAATQTTAPVPVPVTVPVPQPTPRKRGLGPAGIVGFTMVGVGGAAVIGGIVMDIIASSSRPDESAACASAAGKLLCRDADRDAIEESNTLALAGDITWIAGAAVLVAGGTLATLDLTGVLGKRRGDKNAGLDLRLAPHGAGLQLLGTF